MSSPLIYCCRIHGDGKVSDGFPAMMFVIFSLESTLIMPSLELLFKGLINSGKPTFSEAFNSSDGPIMNSVFG
jgi:hypothetical protein